MDSNKARELSQHFTHCDNCNRKGILTAAMMIALFRAGTLMEPDDYPTPKDYAKAAYAKLTANWESTGEDIQSQCLDLATRIVGFNLEMFLNRAHIEYTGGGKHGEA